MSEGQSPGVLAAKVAAGVAAVGLAVTLIATNVGEGTDAAQADVSTEPSQCSFLIGNAGELAVPNGDNRCTLTFTTPAKRKCSMRPVVEDSIGYQWSYDVSEVAIVVDGLRPGARVAFECKESH